MAVWGSAAGLGLLVLTLVILNGPLLDYLARGPRVTRFPARDGASATVFEDSVPACTGCTLSLEEFAVCGSIDDRILLRGFPIVQRDSRGLLYAAVPVLVDHEIVRYSPAGEVLGVIGSYGDGPGEMRVVWDMVSGPGDTLFAAHDATLSVFDSSGAFVSSVRLEPAPAFPGMNRLITISDSLIVTTEYRRGDSRGHPLHVYGRDGQYLKSVGPPALDQQFGVSEGTLTATFPRIASPDAMHGWIWLAGPGYRLEAIDLEGRTRRLIGVRTPMDWNTQLFMTLGEYEAHMKAPEEHDPPVPPPFTLRDVSPLRQNVVGVLAQIPSENWRTVREAEEGMNPDGPPPGADHLLRLYDTALDAIDVRSGTLLARQRIPGLAFFTRDGTLYTTSVDALGVVTIKLFEVKLVVP